MDDQIFNTRLIVGLGQDDGGGQLISGGAEGGTDTSVLNPVGDGTDSGDGTDGGGGTTTGGGGGGGGGGAATTPSTTGGVSQQISNALSSAAANVPGGTPTLVVGAVAVIGGIAAIAYFAHRKTVQGHAHR
jgi:hypothetical protein